MIILSKWHCSLKLDYESLLKTIINKQVKLDLDGEYFVLYEVTQEKLKDQKFLGALHNEFEQYCRNNKVTYRSNIYPAFKNGFHRGFEYGQY